MVFYYEKKHASAHILKIYRWLKILLMTQVGLSVMHETRVGTLMARGSINLSTNFYSLSKLLWHEIDLYTNLIHFLPLIVSNGGIWWILYFSIRCATAAHSEIFIFNALRGKLHQLGSPNLQDIFIGR